LKNNKFFLILYLSEKNQFISLQPFRTNSLLKGMEDSIPALRRKGSKEREKLEKTSHFLFGGEDKNINFVVPKAN